MVQLIGRQNSALDQTFVPSDVRSQIGFFDPRVADWVFSVLVDAGIERTEINIRDRFTLLRFLVVEARGVGSTSEERVSRVDGFLSGSLSSESDQCLVVDHLFAKLALPLFNQFEPRLANVPGTVEGLSVRRLHGLSVGAWYEF